MIQRCTCHSARVMNRGIGTRHGLKVVLATLISLSLFATPALANPGNGNGNGNSGNHGNNSDNHGNKGNAQKGNAGQKNNASSDHRKKYGKPDHVDSDISFFGCPTFGGELWPDGVWLLTTRHCEKNGSGIDVGATALLSWL
jgi:hypothetical protein